MNEKINELIKDLPPELREKAKECKTLAELNDLAADNDIELPEDALENIAGGQGCDNRDPFCPVHSEQQLTVKNLRDGPTNYYCPVCGINYNNTQVNWKNNN